MLSSRLFRLTGVDDLDGVCPSLTCSFPSLLVRLLLRSVAVSAADDDDAVDLSDLLLADLLFFVLLFAAEGPGLVDRVILSFFFFFLLSFFGLGSLAHVIGRGGRLMVTTRAPLLPALLLDRRDDALNPKSGYYLKAGAAPFVGTDPTGFGIKIGVGVAKVGVVVGERVVRHGEGCWRGVPFQPGAQAGVS